MSSLLLAVAVTVIALCLPVSTAGARPALGVNIVSPFDPSQVAEVEALHPDSVRVFVLIKDVQPSAGAPLNASQASAYATFVNRMSNDGIRVDFVVVGAPGSSALNTPADPNTYADFMSKFAALFPNRGVAYELWNEEDVSTWWASSVPAYAALVERAYPVIKRADPSSTVVLGPTTGNNYDYINQLYASGIKGNFDAVGVHTDTACSVASPDSFYRENNRIGQYSFLGYKEVHATMLANGDDKPIWMTEFGWSSTNGGPTSCQNGASAGKKPSGVTQATQAAYLTQAVRCMSLDPYLAEASWYTMRDAPSQPSPEFRSYGLLAGNGAHKPSYDQMNGLLRGSISAAGSCADLTGPNVSFIKPVEKQKFKGTLKIRVLVTDPSGIKGVRFYSGKKKFTSVNKSKIVNSGKPIKLKWLGAQCLKKGKRRIKAVAIDKLGNKSFAQVTVKKTTKAKKGKSCKKKSKKKKKK